MENFFMKTFVYSFFIALLLTIPANISGNKNIVSKNTINNVINLTDANFDKTIKEGVVLVDFWAPWCGPCRIFAPTIEVIASEVGKKAKIAKLDVDKNKVTSNKYDVMYIPTIIIFKNGNPEYRFVGAQDKETLINAINLLQ